jgi:hemoglobin/transferrin/lactoferrin receptor protein
MLVLGSVPELSQADDSGRTAAPLALDPVVVVSTRSPRPVAEVVGMVTVLDASDIEANLVTSEDGLWRYTPGILVESSGDRFSARSLSIRGVGGNRVLMEVDGIPIQERLAVGTFAYAGRTGAELDFIRRIEVLRGPASSLYGSRAIGGVVAVSTFDPEDLAPYPGSTGARIRGAYSGDWDSTGASALGAWRGEAIGVLLGGSYRRGHELDRSAEPENPDRLDRDRAAMLAKLTLAGQASERLRLTLEYDRDEADSEMNSLIGEGRFAATTALLGDDRVTRRGVALDGSRQLGTLDFDGVVFLRDTQTEQDTVDLREALPRPVRVDREFRYDTQIAGARTRLSREFTLGDWRHRVLLGADYSRTRSKESRDALQTDLLSGESSNVVLGETFPLRDFPITVSQEAGLYLQNEIDWLDGPWTIIPSLRFDRTRIRVDDDATWEQAHPETLVAEPTVSDWSPRLGALWRPTGSFQAWAQLASGFRAPPAEDLNIGLDIPLFRVRALPNPELASETSLGWEVGLRTTAAGAWFSAAAFWTDYEDFIVSLVPLGPDPETGTLLFQSQNLAKARIKGVELEAGMPLALLSSRLEAFSTGVNGYWAHGEDRRTGERLADVSPPSAAAFLDWVSASGAWELRLNGIFTQGRKRVSTDEYESFRVPGYGVLDFAAAWHASPRLSLRAGVYNFTDRTWWRWGDVRGLPADDPLIPALSAPGRSFSASFELGFGPGR